MITHGYLAYRGCRRRFPDCCLAYRAGLRRRLGRGLEPPSSVLPNPTLKEFRLRPGPRLSTRSFLGDCIASMAKLPGRSASTWFSPIRPTICSSNRRYAPGPEPRRWRRRRLGQVRELLRLRQLYARLALGRAPRHEKERDALGDRLLPQHFPRRRDPAGSRLLAPQRHRVAQGQSDAELRRPSLHECARDHDLGIEKRRFQKLHVPLRSDEIRQRRPADALGLVHSRSAPATSA